MTAAAAQPRREGGSLQALFQRIAASDRLSVLALMLFALLTFTPGFTTLPPTDRDESRFAQASKQMLESGDFVAIRFQDEARLKKPVGIYWLQALAVSAGEALGVEKARTTIALYRIPSLCAALGAVFLTWWAGLPLAGRRAALLAGLMMAGSFLLNIEARLAKTDATLLFTVLAMMGVLARLWAGRAETAPETRSRWLLPGIFWTAAALSVLIKGPIGPMVPAFTIAAVVVTTREWRWLAGLRWLPGLVWMLVLVSPWFIAIMVQTKGAFLQQSLGNDMLSKVAGGKEGHGAPPGTYLAAAQFFFWPFAPLAIVAVPWVWRNRRQASVLFLLAWLVPFWLVFEVVPTKLPHYVLPAYPALALLVSAALVDDGLARRLWARIVTLLVPLLALALPLALMGAGYWFDHVVIWWLLPFAVVAVMLAVLAWRRLGAGQGEAGVLLSALAALTLFWGLGWVAIPAVPSIWPAPRLMEIAQRATCKSPHFTSLGLREPSLVFAGGTDLQMADNPGEAAAFLAGAGGACRIAFVEQASESAFSAALTASAAKATLLGRAHAVNLNGNKPVEMGVYEAAAP